MAAELPGLKDLQAAYRSRWPAGAGVLRPEVPGGARPAWGTAGHAIEHRLRYAFADIAELSPGVETGILMAAGGPDHAASAAICQAGEGLRAALADLVGQERPASRHRGIVLRQDAEERLLRICFAMAWFEEVYRTGRLWPGTPLGDADLRLTTSRLLAAVPGYAVADLDAQIRLAAERLAAPRAASLPGQVRPWPVFAGSSDVGGADADLIIGDLLLDVKARASATLGRDDVYQVLGYLLLDYHDSYRIGRVGWYLTRHGHLVTWTVPECLSLLGARHDLAELRQMLAGQLAASAGTVVGTTLQASR